MCFLYFFIGNFFERGICVKLGICILFLIIGYGAILFILHAIFSFIKCGCGKFAPFVVTTGQAKKVTLDLARNQLKQDTKEQLIIDLGSGSGTLLIPLALEFPQHRFVGYEWDYIPFLWAKWRGRHFKNLKFVRQNFMDYNCGKADIVFCYIIKAMSEPLGKKLQQEIKADCLVICELFPLNHLKLIQRVDSSLYGMPISLYLYEKK